MKKSNLFLSLVAGFLTVSALAGCQGGNDGPKEFNFTVKLESGKSNLQFGETDQISIVTNKVDDANRTYTYRSSNDEYATVSESGVVTAGNLEGTVQFTVTETTSNIRQKLSIEIVPNYIKAEGGFNFASQTGDAAIKERTKILGQLEKYAMDTHLTGITMFENGGYIKYSPDVTLPTETYITGYGFGVLSEGSINNDLAYEANAKWKRYYHSASSSDPQTINGYNATGSQVSDLHGYITSSFWGTKINPNETNKYMWYPVLAKDQVNGKTFSEPIPVYEEGHESTLGLYDTWKIYVKTGEAGEEGLVYRYNGIYKDSLGQSFDKRPVKVEDYATAFKMLLTGANKQKRGAELAGDTSYGIVGGQKFYNTTKSLTDESVIDNYWNTWTEDGTIGVKTGKDANGSYIQLRLVNEIDAFTAMYTLSSSLYSPLPEEFIKQIGGGSYIKGMKNYGNLNNDGVTEGYGNVVNFAICCGPYTLEKWDVNQQTVFEKNDMWFESGRYKIPGVHIRIMTNATQDETAIYKEFNQGHLHACGIPTDYLDKEIGQPHVYETKGDSTFKLNVNSCTPEMWTKLFGPNGEIFKNNESDRWDVKPWMSNDDFLKGLFHSINRKEFAEKRGVQPSINYFSDAYLSDPEKGVSYNATDEHKEAVKNYQVVDGEGRDMYGFSKTLAVNYFKKAINTLISQGDLTLGTPSKPTPVKICIKWMYESDIKDYGDDIKKYFEDAFNDEEVCGGCAVLNVDQSAVTNWEDVYNEVMMKGKFDLAFGAISGNTYNPLNFLEVLKSDNSSGFTLNFGPDTSICDPKNPLVYTEEGKDPKEFSFDALWEAADHGAVIKNGSIVKPIQACYMESPKSLDTGAVIDDLTKGAKIEIPVEFAEVSDGATFDVKEVQLYVGGSNYYSMTKDNATYEYDKDAGVIRFTISPELASTINEDIREVNKLNKDDARFDATPFNWGSYNVYWAFELTYTIQITGKSPSQNYSAVGKNKDAKID